jgi:hypothetical protein
MHVTRAIVFTGDSLPCLSALDGGRATPGARRPSVPATSPRREGPAIAASGGCDMALA